MFDCTTDSYETLYARWLEKPGELLDWAGYDPAKHSLLDLCGGTGAVAKEAFKRGGPDARAVWLLDLNPRIRYEDARADAAARRANGEHVPRDRRQIYLIQGKAEDLKGRPVGKFNPLACDECWYPYNPTPDRRCDTPWDLIVCRQALGYLNLKRLAAALYSVLPPGGRFVCNNFVQPKWAFKKYEYQGRRFVEASGYLGRRVFHLQATPGDFDITTFRWHTPEEVEEAFAKPCWALGRREITSRSARFSFVRCA